MGTGEHVLGLDAARKQAITLNHVRADTTVTECNIHWPTDSSLLWDVYRVAVREMARGRDLDPLSCPWRNGYGHAGPRAPNWLRLINEPQSEAEVAALRESVARGSPFDSVEWKHETAERLGLEYTLRPRGRPRKGTKVECPECPLFLNLVSHLWLEHLGDGS